MEYKDYYKTLGVDKSASQAEIKKAYRKMARKYHPDVSKESNAEAQFKEVGEAYEVLKDTSKRQAYDQFGSNYQKGQNFRPPPGWESDHEFSNEDLGGFSDFFESMFGGARQQSRQPNFSQAGNDTYANININVEDSYHGNNITVTIREPQGDIVKLNVKIPKGITEGKKIRLSGKGSAGRHGGQPGDLYLTVKFREHPWFQIEQQNILLNLPISPWEAALGCTVETPTLAGQIELKINKGAQSGQKMRLKGRGLPGRTIQGDMYVILKMVTPEADNDEKTALYQKMQAIMDYNPREEIGN